ncbi:MAG TPA: glucose/sorbosone dehydrogenase [Verrucomicrobiae bacterium]|jgi:glucose/arabinose dehydrogenase|nr:glucose/sorbosone dehydrogenase [Verrucomicrobiae bacterium]
MKRAFRASIVAHLVLCAAALTSVCSPQSASETKLTPHTVRLKGKSPFSLLLPAGFKIVPAAEGLKRVRFMAKSPDGRIFVTTMHDLSDNTEGAIYILDGFDEQRGKFARVIPYLTNLHNPNSIAFYKDAQGQDWIYLALTDRLVRYKFVGGEERPTSHPEVLATYPAYGLSYKYGGWHLTRTIAFGPSDKLYVTVGSSCNACDEKEEIRATLSVMDVNGKNQRIIARGLRNAVGMRFVGDSLFLTNMGADHLGDDAPDDPMFSVSPGALREGKLDYGWPHCYYSGGKAKSDVRSPLEPSRKDCQAAPDAFSFFGAHSSPLGLDYFGVDSTEPLLKDHFLVALHGASNKTLGRGYRVVSVDGRGQVQDLITGLIKGRLVRGRPCDILKLSENSFLLSDDYANVIYYVHPK